MHTILSALWFSADSLLKIDRKWDGNRVETKNVLFLNAQIHRL